jgi:competence CoiA-like predicted nuclease
MGLVQAKKATQQHSSELRKRTGDYKQQGMPYYLIWIININLMFHLQFVKFDSDANHC